MNVVDRTVRELRDREPLREHEVEVPKRFLSDVRQMLDGRVPSAEFGQWANRAQRRAAARASRRSGRG